MNISELPKKKNIVKFTDKELFLWLEDYIEGWGKSGVSASDHYEIIKTEITRRSSQRMYLLTIVNMILSVGVFLLALVTAFKK